MLKFKTGMVNYLLSLLKRKKVKSSSIKEDLLIKQGREEFRKLIDKGIELPVVLL